MPPPFPRRWAILTNLFAYRADHRLGEPPRGAEFTIERPLELPFDKFLRKLSRTPGQPATRDANLCVAEASLCVPRSILYTYVCPLPACMHRCIQSGPRLKKFCQCIFYFEYNWAKRCYIYRHIQWLKEVFKYLS